MLTCKFCERECKNSNSHRNHERMCKENPLRQKPKNGFSSDKTPWNKGLSKETDSRVLRYSETTSVSMKKKFDSGYRNFSQTPEYWTEEKRKAKSEWKKQLHITNPEIHPNRKLAGNRSKMTYPEQIAFDYLTRNNIEFETQKKILHYFVDFCIGELIIEIDGERWHPIGNEKDKLRDLDLQNNGYRVIRIRSKEHIEKRLEEILLL